jgi:hypothetical protein
MKTNKYNDNKILQYILRYNLAVKISKYTKTWFGNEYNNIYDSVMAVCPQSLHLAGNVPVVLTKRLDTDLMETSCLDLFMYNNVTHTPNSGSGRLSDRLIGKRRTGRSIQPTICHQMKNKTKLIQ